MCGLILVEQKKTLVILLIVGFLLSVTIETVRHKTAVRKQHAILKVN